MRKLLRFSWIFLVAAVCSHSSASVKENSDGYLLDTDTFSISVARTDLSFRVKDKLPGSRPETIPGRIFFLDGKDGTAFNAGTVSGFKPGKNSLSFNWRDHTGRIEIAQKITAYPEYVAWSITPGPIVKSEQTLLSLGFELVLPSGGYAYWDGNKEVKSLGTAHLRDKWIGTFPLVCAYTGTSGIAVGNAASDIVSYLENSVLPRQDGTSSVRYGTRLVVDEHRRDTVTFILYTYDARYGGFKPALQTYYDIYPEFFSPRNVHPRLKLSCAGNLPWSCSIPKPISLEFMRRLYCYWNWSQCPFKRAGDVYCENDLWNFQDVYPRPSNSIHILPAEEYRALRKNLFSRSGGEIVNAFYIAPMWMEQQLLNERFPDARITPEMEPFERTVYNEPWVTHDNEYKVFPYRTSYEPFLQEGMKKVAAEVDIAGWAFDIADDIGKYRGPALNKCEGRAFDNQGTYVDLAVAFTHVIDYAHTLRSAGSYGYTLGMIENIGGGGVFPAVFRGDAAIYEDPPYMRFETASIARYMCGRKPLTWWRDYRIDKVFDWESMTPAEIREAFLVARDELLLDSFYLGGFPFYIHIKGVPRIFKYMPVLLETVNTGWEPLVPIKPDDRFFLSRYGRGVSSIICIGNKTDNAVTTRLEIENRFLGECNYAFVPYAGEELDQEVGPAYTVIPRMLLPGRTPSVLKAQIGFKTRENLTVAARQEGDDCRRVLTVSVTTRRAFSDRVVVREEPGMRTVAVSLNGRPIRNPVRAGQSVSFDAALRAGENTIIVTRHSEIFDSPETDITGFPVMKGDRSPDCTAIFAAGDPESRRLAARVQEYFQFYGGNLQPPVKIDIPVADDSSPAATNLVVIDIGGRNKIARQEELVFNGISSVYVKGLKNGAKVLYVGGKDYDAVLDAFLSMLRLWDKKYVYYGAFPDTTNLYEYQKPNGDFAARKAGLAGKLLD